MEPDADRFRALARSAPWRFRTLQWTHRSRRPGEDDVVVQAWLKRPGRLLVVDGDGQRHVERGLPYTTSMMSSGGGGWFGRRRRPAPVVDRVRPTPDAVDVPRRQDGLVADRPGRTQVDYDDPIWQDYRWVAMLDPVELSYGVQLSDLRQIRHHGRPAWAGRAVAVDGYDPRCTCCALLWGEVSAAMLARSGGPPLLPTEDLPEAHEVILDVQTGIVVRARALGGEAPGVGFDTEINEVDAPMDDDLFR